jgi:hypothetical protein
MARMAPTRTAMILLLLIIASLLVFWRNDNGSHIKSLTGTTTDPQIQGTISSKPPAKAEKEKGKLRIAMLAFTTQQYSFMYLVLKNRNRKFFLKEFVIRQWQTLELN